MAHRDQLGAFVDHRLQRLGIHPAVLVVGDDGGLHAVTFRGEQVEQVVAGVLGLAGEDAVPRLERDGRECAVPGDGGVLDQGDLVTVGAEQSSDGVIGRFQLFDGLVLRLVPARRRFQPEVFDDRIDHLVRRQRRAGVVEVDEVPGGGSVGAQAVDVDQRFPRISPVASASPTVGGRR